MWQFLVVVTAAIAAFIAGSVVAQRIQRKRAETAAITDGEAGEQPALLVGGDSRMKELIPLLRRQIELQEENNRLLKQLAKRSWFER